MGFSLFGSAARREPPAVAETLCTGIISTTPLYTFDGALPAASIVPGDRVISRTSGTAIVRDVVVREVTGLLVRMAPDTLGRARPEGFTLLAPDQRLFLRKATGAPVDGLYAARDLVDGDTVKWHEPKRPVRMIQLEFDDALILYAGGLEVEVATGPQRTAL
ncbi:Hint domain-containing protein [Aliiruegeria haliotis]|uniref:Hint domain-containing protein n=1 Tax=Aliiruegeria haliotis TaxID=1280846 RepID=A0A2T0RXP2_9RHOB|nr:Hint domain-containing protein [Aliiruegeria haliotis]PRY25941.1 Hint domain-containing protein [Aliiruegeria haliotis]